MLVRQREHMDLSAAGRPENVLALHTVANFFSLLGVDPLLGRTWVAREDQPGKDAVTILSYGLWMSRFAEIRMLWASRLT
jgi:putative ABC transport system permease protein